MIKQIIIIICQIFKRPSNRLSNAWRTEQLHDYEEADRKAAGIY